MSMTVNDHDLSTKIAEIKQNLEQPTAQNLDAQAKANFDLALQGKNNPLDENLLENKQNLETNQNPVKAEANANLGANIQNQGEGKLSDKLPSMGELISNLMQKDAHPENIPQNRIQNGAEKESGTQEPGIQEYTLKQNSENLEQNNENLLSANAMFANMFPNMNSQAMAGATTLTPEMQTTTQSLPVADIVDRILVNQENISGSKEVIISLGGDFKGTEVKLSLSNDNFLLVQLSCKNASTFQTAVAEQQSLLNALKTNVTENVRVEIQQASNSAGANEGDQNRRSAMYQAQEELD